MLFQRRRACEGCEELREELAKAQSKLDALVLDWQTVQDKVHRWMQRTNARARAEEKELGAAPRAVLGEGNGGAVADPVSAKILARRARLRPPGNLPPLVNGGDGDGGDRSVRFERDE